MGVQNVKTPLILHTQGLYTNYRQWKLIQVEMIQPTQKTHCSFNTTVLIFFWLYFGLNQGVNAMQGFRCANRVSKEVHIFYFCTNIVLQ